MLRFPIIILFGFLILSFLIANNRFEEVTLMGLLLAWFIKFNALYSSERSREDMHKSIVEKSVFVKLWIGLQYVSSNML